MFGFLKKKDEPLANHWQQFEGKGNANEILTEKARLLALVLVDWTRTGTKHLIETLQKDLDKKTDSGFGQVFFETILFYLHYTDRLAFGYLTKEQRDIFVDALTKAIEEALLEAQPSEKEMEDFRLMFGSMYNERQTEYSKYKIAAEKGEALANTLFWEFEKRIIKILGFEQGAIAMMQVHVSVTTALKFLRIPTLFETT